MVNNKMEGRISLWWVKKNLFFGTRILPSNMVAELNTKIDVICLGVLVKDVSQIGIYSFAVLFTEGYYMMYYTIRRIVNPGISESNAQGNLEEYVARISRYLNKYVLAGGGISLTAIIGTYATMVYLINDNKYYIGILYIMIIGMAIAINARSIIWGDFLNQIGHPFDESKINMLSVVSNTVSNLCFIQLFGTLGASIGTAISYFVFSRLQNEYIKKITGKRLLSIKSRFTDRDSK